MIEKDFTKYTDSELFKKREKTKSENVFNALLIGVFVGIAIYSAAINGIGFFTFFPLFFVYLLYNNRKKIEAIEKEIKSRNLKQE